MSSPEMPGRINVSSPEMPVRIKALNTRDTIGMAKGILMQRENVPADQAFTMLVSASQHANMKLHDVADWLVSEIGFTRQRGRPSP